MNDLHLLTTEQLSRIRKRSLFAYVNAKSEKERRKVARELGKINHEISTRYQALKDEQDQDIQGSVDTD